MRLRNWFRGHENSEYALTLFYATLIGVAAGILGASFHRLMAAVQALFFRVDETGFAALPWTSLLLIPVAGGVIQAALARMFPEVASHKGVIEVMKALKRHDGDIPLKVTLFHMIAPALNIGTGGSVGPEGPAVQFGAGIASAIGRFFHVSPARLKVMVAAGAGAAISAIFNAPLGGVFFTLEIILLNDLKDVTFGVLILASVVANVVAHTLSGAHNVFDFPAFPASKAIELPLFLVLGLVGGIVSVGFSRWSGFLAKQVWGRWRKVPRWIFPPLSGLLIGAVALAFPQVLGVGYHGINQLLGGQILWTVAALLLALKLALTALNIEFGGFGGIIAPSLFIGAMLGGVIHGLTGQLGWTLDPTVFVLVGMGTVLAGMNGIPLTAFLLLIEMTGNYDLVLPMMVAVSAATLVIQFLVGERSLYFYKLRKARLLDDDLDPAALLAGRRALELARDQRPTVAASARLQDILGEFARHDLKDLVVLDDDGRVSGMVDFADLRFIIGQPDAMQVIRVAEVADEVPVVGPETSLAEFLAAVEGTPHDYLPVRDADGQLTGIVFRSTVTRELNSVMRNREIEKERNRWAFK